jgi:hypothetical protein
VLASARALTLAGAAVPLSVWAPIAYLWQDLLVVLVFLAVDAAMNRPAPAWVLYGAIVVYAAVNVPVTRILSTPLTWTIIRAARGPIADSVTHYATPINLIGLVVPIAIGALLPVVLARRPLAVRRGVVGAALLIVAAGPVAVSRTETHGMHRNALGALVATSLPRLNPAGSTIDWRASPFGDRAGADLTSFRGSMAGQNVVLVVLESTGARHLGLYGAERDPAPNLTELARRAIVFERAYSVYPESIKGLFATLCSRYPAFDTAPEIYGDVPCASLPRRLQSAGYRTALFHSGRFAYLGMRSVIDNRGFDLLEDAGAIGGVVESSFGVDEPSAVRRLLGWIDALPRDARFFVTYLPVAGHHPYATTAPGPFSGTDDFTRYLNALHEGDEALGRLVRGLRERHLDERTLVIVFGDHGEAFGEHPGNFAHTLFIHEENVRVPYVIAAPGAIATTMRVPRIASVIDTAPTLLDLLGLPADERYQGHSLLRPDPRMALFYTDYSIGWLGLADACWKYLYEMDSGRSRLFDVCEDPAETRDRAGEFPERVEAYRDRVKQWAAAQKDLIGGRR